MAIRTRRFDGLDGLKSIQPKEEPQSEEPAGETLSRKTKRALSTLREDDPMGLRKRRFDGLEDIDTMQPRSDPQAAAAVPPLVREPIRGAGSDKTKGREKDQEATNTGAKGITPGDTAIIRALATVNQTLERLAPNASQRARPTNV